MLVKVQDNLVGNFSKKSYDFSVGDLVSIEFLSSVGSSRLRKFKGVCILKRKSSFGFFFTLRAVLHRVGVEFSFFSYSGFLLNVYCVSRKYVSVNTSKCYRLRGLRLRISI